MEKSIHQVRLTQPFFCVRRNKRMTIETCNDCYYVEKKGEKFSRAMCKQKNKRILQ